MGKDLDPDPPSFQRPNDSTNVGPSTRPVASSKASATALAASSVTASPVSKMRSFSAGISWSMKLTNSSM